MKNERAQELRRTIDRLPLSTRQAMLEGIQTNPIIVGADGNLRGGVCPMYAAYRAPSRKQGRSFARAWDRYARARLPREASERELLTLQRMLEASIELETEPVEPVVSLSEAISAYKAAKARSQAKRDADDRERARPAPRTRRDTHERDRTGELEAQSGWAWLRPFRRYDDYERALLLLEEAQRGHGSESEQPGVSESEQRRSVLSPAGRG